MATYPRVRCSLILLVDGVENVETVGFGDEATGECACAAAADAIVGAAVVFGRQEYRLTLVDTEMIVLPGLDEAECWICCRCGCGLVGAARSRVVVQR